jgi:hypothetical protein
LPGQLLCQLPHPYQPLCQQRQKPETKSNPKPESVLGFEISHIGVRSTQAQTLSSDGQDQPPPVHGSHACEQTATSNWQTQALVSRPDGKRPSFQIERDLG